MLDAETKLRIDSARQMLVGKVPDPKSQVEQITIALIYKFMDDMDAEAEDLGGKRKFFTGKFAKYGWAQLMSPSLGGHDMLALYSEGIAKMPENPGIPLLFRDIFKNAFLPYRDPETLKAFLKIINEFSYDHSERLGDAFEYLLSVLGSQGDAGQFRTPRHIIDFMVEILNPQKGEVVLDPACGTAGFLISAYKHIVKANTDAKGHSKLTPADRGKMAENFKGYDISPDMVRLSLVNMYLHGFTDPHIHEYDTLTSDERWNEYADVILANPPFMSPTGGIKPHKRFSIQAKRSEVLFVDYMAEHLTPNGRAGIIVPEGIIFQSQTAYTQLRKMLVENYLVAVVSLPAGAFNPYSGVKTSILILDKSIARRSDDILFIKIENEGTDLATRRRATDGSDLPMAQTELNSYFQAIRSQQLTMDQQLTLGLIVPKRKIAESGDYNLSGERYREGIAYLSSFPSVRIGELFERAGKEKVGRRSLPVMSITMKEGLIDQSLKFKKRIASDDISAYKVVLKNELVVGFPIDEGVLGFLTKHEAGAVSPAYGIWAIRPEKRDAVVVDYLERILRSPKAIWVYRSKMQGAVSRRRSVPPQIFAEISIPLPPIAMQKEIVAELEVYQKVISGARAVIDNYRPRIAVRHDWETVLVGDVVEFISGLTVSIPEVEAEDGTPILAINNVTEDGRITLNGLRWIKPPKKTLNYVQKGDLLFNWRNGSKNLVGKTAMFNLDGQYLFASFLLGIRPHKDRVDSSYLWHTLNLYRREGRYLQFMRQNVNGLFNREELKMVKIPLPPLATQQAIVAEIEAEQALVDVNRELIARFEKKIQVTLARVWGDVEVN